MVLPFLDRRDETARLARFLRRRGGGLAVLYGRRRCGKSRLLGRVLDPARCVYYVGDGRESILQRAALAREVGRLLPGFDRVEYPGWDEFFTRLRAEARPGRSRGCSRSVWTDRVVGACICCWRGPRSG